MEDELSVDLTSAARQLVALRGADGQERATVAGTAAELRRQRVEEAATAISAELVPQALAALEALVQGRVPKDRAHGMNAAARTILEAAQVIGAKAPDHNARRAVESMTVGELEHEISRTRAVLEARKRAERVIADLVPTDTSPEV